MFSAISGPQELQQLEQSLDSYSTQLNKYASQPPATRTAEQDSIREHGHQLSLLTQDMHQRQRGVLTKTTGVAVRTVTTLPLVTVILIALASAMMIVRQVLRPLRDLSDQLVAVADGHIRELTMHSKDREIESVVLHFNDMLGRLRSQQSRLRKHEQAAALGVLVSGVAHELNNPLSNISTSVQLLLESEDATSRELRDQWMSHIDEESERARRIVRRLLDSVRQPRLHLSACEADLVEASVDLVKGQPATEVHILQIVDSRRYPVIANACSRYSSTWSRMPPTQVPGMSGLTQTKPPGVNPALPVWSWCAGIQRLVDEVNTVIRIEISDDGPGIPAGQPAADIRPVLHHPVRRRRHRPGPVPGRRDHQ